MGTKIPGSGQRQGLATPGTFPASKLFNQMTHRLPDDTSFPALRFVCFPSPPILQVFAPHHEDPQVNLCPTTKATCNPKYLLSCTPSRMNPLKMTTSCPTPRSHITVHLCVAIALPLAILRMLSVVENSSKFPQTLSSLGLPHIFLGSLCPLPS